jgi:hypothetical protein
VGKIILLLLVGLAAAFYFEGSREWILDKAKPVVDPYLVMATRSEMEKIAQDLAIHQRENFGRIPDRRGFPDWLEGMYAGGANEDSWGSPYEYTLGRDSFYLRSPGPDQMRGTEDDITQAGPLLNR